MTALVVCAETDAEAEAFLASAMALSFAQRRSGRPPGPLPTLGQVSGRGSDVPDERAYADSFLRSQVVGSPATLRTRLEQLLADTAADELMAIASVPDADARSRSFTLLAELADLPRG